MKIILETIKQNLNYPNKKYNDNLLEINSLYDWINASSKPLKCMHAFDVLFNEKKEFSGKILVDHTEYAPLLLIFNSTDDLLLYCQDTCEARGDKIPINIQEALNCFASENVHIHKIIELSITENEWEETKEKIKKQK